MHYNNLYNVKHGVVQAYHVPRGAMTERRLGEVAGAAGQPAKKRKARSQVTQLLLHAPHQRIIALPHSTKPGRDSNKLQIKYIGQSQVT